MTFPAPDITERNRPYWNALTHGQLMFQRCKDCNEKWLPARGACPTCLSQDTTWEQATGRGKIVSWVVYHHAYADHLKAQIPYDVTIVELEEGPRLLTNITNSGAGGRLSVGLPVNLAVETVEGVPLARFRLEH